MSTAGNQINSSGISLPVHTWQDLFLEKYAETLNMRGSANYAGVSHVTVYNHIKKDPEFARKVEIARMLAIETLEGAAYDRATNGVERVFPAWYKGERIGERVERQFSDGLAEFFLKHNKPEIYNPTQRIDHTITVDQTGLKEQLTVAVQNGLNLGMSLSETLKYLTLRGVDPEHLKLVQGSDLVFPESKTIDIDVEPSHPEGDNGYMYTGE